MKIPVIEWKIGDNYTMYPIGVDFKVTGIIKTKEELKTVKLFSELYKHK